MRSTEPQKHADPLCVEIGIILQEERAVRGMTLERFAEFLGLSRQEVRFVECAAHAMNLRTLRRMAGAVVGMMESGT